MEKDEGIMTQKDCGCMVIERYSSCYKYIFKESIKCHKHDKIMIRVEHYKFTTNPDRQYASGYPAL